MSYKTLIFDFDYTLADSSEGAVQCINYALEEMGLALPTTEEARKTIGLSLPKTFFKLASKKYHTWSKAERFSDLFIERADEVMTDLTVMFDSVSKVIPKLKDEGYKLGIVSTKLRYRIENILGKEGLVDFFDVIIVGEDVSSSKPDPEGLLTAIEKLESGPEETLYIGDSITDAKTAEKAGVDFAAVLTGTTEKEDFAGEDVLDFFTEIDDLLYCELKQ